MISADLNIILPEIVLAGFALLGLLWLVPLERLHI